MSLELARRGEKLVLLDIAERPVAPLPSGCEYVRTDLSVQGSLAQAIERFRPNTIVHLASLLSASCEADRPRAWRVNMDATFELFESALATGVNSVLFPSSVASYGGNLPDPLPEDFPQWPQGLYGVTKLAIERLGVYYHQRHGLDFRCLRIPVVVSRHAPAGAASAYVSRAFVEAVQRGRFVFPVPPNTRIAVIYILDILRGITLLLDAPAQRLTRRVYNVHGLAPSADQIRRAILATLPQTHISFNPDPGLTALISTWPAEIIDESARRDWGWSPAYDLPAMTEHFISEIRARLQHNDESGNAS